jgi:hypothetical protein
VAPRYPWNSCGVITVADALLGGCLLWLCCPPDFFVRQTAGLADPLLSLIKQAPEPWRVSEHQPLQVIRVLHGGQYGNRTTVPRHNDGTLLCLIHGGI